MEELGEIKMNEDEKWLDAIANNLQKAILYIVEEDDSWAGGVRVDCIDFEVIRTNLGEIRILIKNLFQEDVRDHINGIMYFENIHWPNIKLMCEYDFVEEGVVISHTMRVRPTFSCSVISFINRNPNKLTNNESYQSMISSIRMWDDCLITYTNKYGIEKTITPEDIANDI